MSDMKLIMEGWRQYSNVKKESTIFLLEHNDPYRVNFNSILEERKIEDAVNDLKIAFEKKMFKDTLNNPEYFNIKKMNLINLK